MSISYYSLEIKTLVEQYDILFSGVFGIDEATNQIIKFYSNTDVNTNILDSDFANQANISSGADWIFDVNHKRFSEKGTIINTSMPLLNIANATKFKIYTMKDVNNRYVNYIDYYNDDISQWNTIQSDEVIFGTNNTLPKTFGFIINFITSTKLVMPKLRIDRYCELQKKLGLSRMKGCFQALPLSKKYNNYNSDEGINITVNCRSLRNKMKYAEYVRIHGITQKSSSSFKQTCRFGATYRY
jgi:hypothetical protein